MKPFTVILVRVLAIYLLAKSFQLGLPFYLETDSLEVIISSSSHMLAYFGYMGVPAVTGLVLWFIAPVLASRIIADEHSTEVLNEQGLVSAGSFLIGIYWAVYSINDIASRYSYDKITFGTFVVLGISVCLILACRHVARFFKKLRT